MLSIVKGCVCFLVAYEECRSCTAPSEVGNAGAVHRTAHAEAVAVAVRFETVIHRLCIGEHIGGHETLSLRAENCIGAMAFEEFEQYNGNIYKIPVDDIALAESFELVTVTVYNADGTVHGTATDSVESYIARSAASDLNEAIMKFAASAKVYFS